MTTTKRKEMQLKKFNSKDLKKLLKEHKVKGFSKMTKSKLVQKVLEMQIDFSNAKSSRVKREMTEERKEILRERLKKARAMRGVNKVKKEVKEVKEEKEEKSEPKIDIPKLPKRNPKTHIKIQIEEDQPIKIIKKTNKKKLKNPNFDDIIKAIKLPDVIQKGVNMQELLKNVLKLLTDELVRKIFASAMNAKTTKKIVKKNTKETPERIVELLQAEFKDKQIKTDDVKVDDSKMDLIEKFISKLEALK